MKRSVRFSYRWMTLAFAVLLGANSASNALAQQARNANPLRPVKGTPSGSVQPTRAVGSAVRTAEKRTPQLASHAEPSLTRPRHRSSGISTAAYRGRVARQHQGFTPVHEQYGGDSVLNGSVLNGTVTVQPQPNEVLEGDVYYENGAEPMMGEFETSGAMSIPTDILTSAKTLFSSARIDGDAMALALRWAYENCGQLLDPHTGVGFAAAREANIDSSIPIVTLATAHPAKFREAVERATGVRPSVPARIGSLFEREERFERLPGDYDAVKAFVMAEAARG